MMIYHHVADPVYNRSSRSADGYTQELSLDSFSFDETLACSIRRFLGEVSSILMLLVVFVVSITVNHPIATTFLVCAVSNINHTRSPLYWAVILLTPTMLSIVIILVS